MSKTFSYQARDILSDFVVRTRWAGDIRVRAIHPAMPAFIVYQAVI